MRTIRVGDGNSDERCAYEFALASSECGVTRALRMPARKRWALDSGEAVERIDATRFRVAATGEILSALSGCGN